MLIIQFRLAHGILDALNAEIALGTVMNVSEGAEWLSYTYLFVRMRKNPMVYGKSCRVKNYCKLIVSQE
jgi:antiviral helicase SLH1